MYVYRFILVCAVAAQTGLSIASETVPSFFLPGNEGGFSETQRSGNNATYHQLSTSKQGDIVIASSVTTRQFLQRIVSEGLEYSSEIKNAQASAEASRHDVERVKGERYPQVKLSTSSSLAGRTGGVRRSPNDTSATLSATTTVYDFGTRNSRIKGGEETVRVADEDIRLTRNQIAVEIMVSVVTINRFHQALAVAREYENRMMRLTEMLDEITQSDTGRRSEYVQARSRLLQAQTHVRQIESHLDETELRLQRLTGRKHVVPDKELDWDSLGSIPLTEVLRGLDTHPSLEKSKAQIRAAQHEVEAAELSRLPSINWTVVRSIDQRSRDEWYTGMNLEWNVFTGGSASSSVSAAKQRVQAVRMEYETELHELQYSVRELARSREESIRKTQEYRSLSAETGNIREMFYEQWYNLGTRTLLDVLSAENEYFMANISTIDNQFEARVANINMMSEASLLLDWLGIYTTARNE
jgi:adhesin transport system outer membrane protein